MSLCPARLGYRDSEGYDGTPSEPMAFGSLVHELIDLFIKGDLDARKMSLQQVKTLFTQLLLADGHFLHELTNEYHVDRICMEAQAAFTKWVQEWWLVAGNFRTTVATEKTRVRPLGMISKSVAVWVRGTPDLVHETGLDDWKTAGRGWDKGKAGTRIQAATYTWLEEDVLDLTEPIPFTYVVFNRQKAFWEPHVVWIDQDCVNAAKSALMAWAKQIKGGVFPPTPAAASGRPGRGWWSGPI